MNSNAPITLARDVEGTIVPVGTKVTLQKGETAHLTQSLGGSYTVIVNGNMFHISGKDADALGIEVAVQPVAAGASPPRTLEELKLEAWNQMKTCYDPEIPVNIVDLGLVYDCALSPWPAGGGHRADIKITLTAPGCGMGPALAQDVQNKLLSIEGIAEANVEVVFEPPWNQAMMSDAAKLQLGLF